MSQGLVQKDLQEHLYISVVVSSDPRSPTPLPSSAVKVPENTEEVQTTLNHHMEISKWDSRHITCTASV
jgi:hypothetical protein